MEKLKSNNKEENILVWLDFDAYSYLNFGIVNALSKLNNFNFFGIVTTKQDISFFEKQQLIPFKKIMYYPDCYINKLSFNIEKFLPPTIFFLFRITQSIKSYILL